MCGIAGIWGPHKRNDLERMLGTLRHRGPDDEGIFDSSEDKMGLVHTRLSILDPTCHGHQPMVSEGEKVVLVYNGEIYNYRELREGIEGVNHGLDVSEQWKKRRAWRGDSDTEVLFQLYLKSRKQGWRPEEMLRRLNGIFAFAIWDAETGELFLARDALGVKPLYYAALPERFIFGSEIKAIWPLLSPPGVLDEASLLRYLTFCWCPGEGTPDRRIRKMNPGEFLRVRKGKIVQQTSWYKLPVFRSLPRFSGSGRQLARETASHLRQAVHRQMISDVPLGAFLSGGLDSSAVVAFAREADPKIRCFTIESGETGGEGFVEDLPYARKVAHHLKVKLDVIQVRPEELAAGLQEMVYHLDEPLADPASLNVLFICRLARRHGIKVLLSGLGGDDLFTGYRRHHALVWLERLRHLPYPLRKTLANISEKIPKNLPFARRLAKFLAAGPFHGNERLVQIFRWIGKKELTFLCSKSFQEALGNSMTDQPMLEFLAGIPNDASPLDRLLALEQRFFLADHNLLYTDKMSMAEGVEVRVPFLDVDLVEFATRIPDFMKQRGRDGKWILKKAMEPYLPKEVIHRPKSGFGAPLRRWFKVELRDWLADTLSMKRLKNRGLFEPAAVQRLIQANASGRVDATYTLLSLACIELWCQQFLDRPTTSTSA